MENKYTFWSVFGGEHLMCGFSENICSFYLSLLISRILDLLISKQQINRMIQWAILRVS